jgi:hypothetical protein
MANRIQWSFCYLNIDGYILEDSQLNYFIKQINKGVYVLEDESSRLYKGTLSECITFANRL